MDGIRSSNGSCEKYVHKFRGETLNATELLQILSIQSGLILKWNFWYIGYDLVEWTNLALDGNQCQNLVNKATNVTGLVRLTSRNYLLLCESQFWLEEGGRIVKRNFAIHLQDCMFPQLSRSVSTITATQAWQLVLIITLHIRFYTLWTILSPTQACFTIQIPSFI
jgi:hypothetical protein